MSTPKEPVIEKRRGFNPFTSIWIVPFTALLISLWLIFQHYSKLGPEIQIYFQNSDGLSADHSVIKFRNIPVGKVVKIGLVTSKDDKKSDDDGVIVTIQMNKNMEQYLNKKAKFWVVKPRVDYSGVSGLDTLISGAYISMYAKKGEETTKKFLGLDNPYRDTNSGSYFLMHSTVSRGIRVGTPINYRNIQIGEVEHVNLSSDGKSIDIVTFVDKKYIKLINKTTKFWLQSLINIGIHGNRLDLDIAPVMSHLVFGGITFETKMDKEYPEAEPSYFYKLYENKYEAEGQRFGKGAEFMRPFEFHFDGDVSGLKKGSTIRFEGFNIGEITSAHIHYSSKEHTMHTSVEGDIDISIFEDSNRSGMENLQLAVKDGLRGKLTTLGPLIGEYYIDMIFDTNSSNSTTLAIATDGKATPFPVMTNREDNIMDELNRFIAKLNSLKLAELIDGTTNMIKSNNQPIRALIDTMTNTSVNLDRTLKKVDAITGDKSMQEMPNKINGAIEELSHTLETTKRLLKGYKSNSLFGDKVGQMLKEINRSSQETKRLLKKLNRKPNSLIFGD